jgi:hypothetical protein
MKETRYKSRGIGRAILMTDVLLVVSGFVALSSGGALGLPPVRGVQDTSPPYVSLDPDDLDFGEQVVGRWSRARRITVTNTGGHPLSVDSVSVGGDDFQNYSVVKDTCTGAKVFPYRACTVDVNFSPSKPERFDAELKVTDNSVTSPRTMRLWGKGVNSSSLPPSDEE